LESSLGFGSFLVGGFLRGAIQAQKEQGLIANTATLLFCLLGNPSVRFVVGVDDYLLHGMVTPASLVGVVTLVKLFFI
jgi:hypothetical protein